MKFEFKGQEGEYIVIKGKDIKGMSRSAVIYLPKHYIGLKADIRIYI